MACGGPSESPSAPAKDAGTGDADATTQDVVTDTAMHDAEVDTSPDVSDGAWLDVSGDVTTDAEGGPDPDATLDGPGDVSDDAFDSGVELDAGDVLGLTCYHGDFDVAGLHMTGCLTSPSPVRILLDGPEVVGQSVNATAVSHQGTHVAVAVRKDATSPVRVMLVTMDGLSTKELMIAPASNRSVDRLAFSADGAWLGVMADFHLAGTHSLYVVPVSGGPSRRVGAAAQKGLSVTGFAWCPAIFPGSKWLAYTGDLTTDGVQELWMANVDQPTSPAVLLSSAQLGPDGDVQSDLAWDGAGRVLFRSNYEGGTWRLYRASHDGAVMEIIPGSDVANDEGAATVGSFGVSPDGHKIAFSANSPVSGVFEVFVLDLPTGEVARVSNMQPLNATGSLSGPALNVPIVFAADGSQLAVVADWRLGPLDKDDSFAAFVMPASSPAGGVRVLGATEGFDLNARDVRFTSQGALVVRGDLVTNGAFELFLVEDTSTPDQDPLTVRFEDVPVSGDVLGLAAGP